MSSLPGAKATLENLERLKAVVGDLSARANSLDQEFAVKSGRARQRRDAALEEQAVQFAADLREAEAARQAALEAAREKFAHRKERIGTAYQASKEGGLQKIENRIGGRKYELQKRVLQAERDRESGLANAAATLQAFKTSLATEQEHLAVLEGHAQQAFRGYRRFLRLFFGAYQKAEAAFMADENRLLGELRGLLTKSKADLGEFSHHRLLGIFKYAPLWVVLAMCEVPLILYLAGFNTTAVWKAGGAFAVSLGVLFILRHLAQRRAQPRATTIAGDLARARRMHDAALEKAEASYRQEIARAQGNYKQTNQTADQELKKALADAGELRVACRRSSDEKAVHAAATNEHLNHARLDRIGHNHTEAVHQLERAYEVRRKAALRAGEETEARLLDEMQAQWQALTTEWNTKVEPLYQAINSAQVEAEKLFPPWQTPGWTSWTPPAHFGQAAKFADVDVDVEKLCGGLPKSQRIALPGPARFPLALCLSYPDDGSVLLETGSTGHDEAIGALNNVILRLLSVAPPGRLNFTILDPVGLGQNFAGVMHLADYEEQIINSRIWTQSGQIEQKLTALNEHMEKVIQMYLRNEYQTIAEYNEQAGVIAEKYHFLVVADFPANFTDAAAKRLLSIAASGARCGVYTLIHWDQRLPLPAEFIPDELRKSSVCLTGKSGAFTFVRRALPGIELRLEVPPSPDEATEFIQRVGQSSIDSSRVEVPFSHVAPAEAEMWTADTVSELRVPIGRTGATKLQYLAIGKGTCQHGLIAGKTGSGKSTLFHVIITNLALWCSPEAVEFYLVDFKKGVEFKCYAAARLPHARVVAIESDREFGLSVLQRLDEELRRRGDLFRRLGVQDLAGYKRAGGAESVPRSLLMVDEFQEFFVEDDTIAQTASLLLDRIVRQGRAFGIHVLLGSQTLGGAYTVARTTLGQMVIRIALQCNEADAYLIMDDTNPAPRLLSRPGEGIYNDTAGTLEGNSPFQTVWLPDQVRESYLEKVQAQATKDAKAYPAPIVFEGNAPAEVRENAVLEGLLAAEAAARPAAARIWLGAPNSIKGPTEAVFHRQSGNNLLLVGQRDEAALAILSVGLVSLAAQYPLGAVRIMLCDGTPPGTPHRNFLERLLGAIPHEITLARPADLGEIMNGLNAEMKQRADAADTDAAPPVFLFIHGLQKYGRLRFEEEFSFAAADPEAPPNPAVVLNNLLCEGTRLGFHVIATCDTYNNVNRFLSRKAFSEFELRVLFQMSANDSASLIDNPKAGLLGLHRALFFNAQEGHLETFRPYALPSGEWLDHVARSLSRLLGAQPAAAL